MRKVYTLGYAARGSCDALDRLMRDPRIILIDIRASSRSRFHPHFRGPSLAQRFGKRYQHVPDFGNVNYRDRTLPILIADPVRGLALVEPWLRGEYNLFLLCACSKAGTCHRSVVARLLQERYGCEVVHL